MAEGISIPKDIGEVYLSLCDHKPTIQREVEFFIQEFEEKRKDHEVANLLKIQEHITELKDTEIPRTHSVGDIHLPKLISELQVCESITDKLLNKLDNSEKSYQERLEENRGKRSEEWDRFVHDMTTKCIRIDNLYRDKQNEARAQFQKAEQILLNKSK